MHVHGMRANSYVALCARASVATQIVSCKHISTVEQPTNTRWRFSNYDLLFIIICALFALALFAYSVPCVHWP
jgi:hypothetical protein